jgi:hypothetical protein
LSKDGQSARSIGRQVVQRWFAVGQEIVVVNDVRRCGINLEHLAVDAIVLLVPLDIILLLRTLEIGDGIVIDPVVDHEAEVIVQSVSFTCQIMEDLKGHRVPVLGWNITLMEVDNVA